MQPNKQSKREAKRLFRTCLVDGALDENRARQTARDVASGGTRHRLPVLAHFLRLVKLDLHVRTAVIESATELPADLRAELTAALARRYGPGLTTTFMEKPSLIGGVRIQVGSDVYDRSIRAGLTALEKSF
jgi:F-type H+-transporting ATPase subunit delta